jgi:hypothetical protein
MEPPLRKGSADEYLKELQKATQAAEKSLQKTKEMMKKRWDKNRKPQIVHQEGDLVLFQADYLPSTRQSKKLDDKWRGPFTVLRRKGNSTYKIDLPKTWKGHWVFNEAQIKRFRRPEFPQQPKIGSRPDPIITNEGREEYKVHDILNQRKRNGKTEYLVRWKDYGPKDDTWEPRENLWNAPEALRHYES